MIRAVPSMKFKNSQHNSLYNDAISAIKAQKWADAIAQLQTLVLFLQESRDKNTAAQINTLIARLNNPVKRMVVLAEVEAHEAHAAEKALCAEIDALEEKAHKEFDNCGFYNAAIAYGNVAAKTKNLPQYKENFAAAIWSQASAYESLAYEIAASTPIKAQDYIEEAIKLVRESLVAYTELNKRFDIDVCTNKLKELKAYKHKLQTQNSQDEIVQNHLLAKFVEVTQAYLKEVPLRSSADGIDILLSLRNTPTYITCPRQKSPALVETASHGYDSQPEADEKPKM